MHFRKGILFLAVLALTTVLAGAQDFGFSGPEANAPMANGSVGTAFSLSGQVDFAGRSFIDTNDLTASKVQTPSSIVARIEISSMAADLAFALRLNPEILSSSPARIIDEASMRTYLGDRLELTAGLTKVIWGKGDSLRVLDVVNPHDYTDPFSPDLEGNKLAQALFKVDLRTSNSGKFEAVYVPFFEGDILPLEGFWKPKTYSDMQSQVRAGFYQSLYNAAYGVTLGGLIESAIAQVYAANGGDHEAAADTILGNPATIATLQANAAQIAASQAGAQADAMIDDLLIFPNTRTLVWGQGGLRYTDSWAGIDFGIQYYTGFLRTPVYNADPANLAATQHVSVDYNRYHQVGLDAAFIFAGFNLRAEAAWHQTADLAGTDPLVRNSFASCVLGLDRTIGNISVNLQTKGTWITGLSGASSSFDVEKDAEELAATLVGQIGYRFWNDRVELSMAASTSLPDRDWMMMPSVKVTPVDNVTLSLGGILFGGDVGGQMGQYADRSFIEAKATYSF